MNTEESKSFKFLKSKNIILITEDKSLIKNVSLSLSDNLNKLKQTNNFINIDNYYEFDLIIVDIDTNDLAVTSSILSVCAKDIPVIVITSKIENKIIKLADTIKLKNIILKNSDFEILKYYIAIVLKTNTTISFNNGYYFDLNKKEFFYNNTQIKLTTLEKDLFIYLINNKNNVISYEQIRDNVWLNKKFTIYGMRNIINKIRKNSYYDIINNVSKNGYIIKNYHIFN